MNVVRCALMLSLWSVAAWAQPPAAQPLQKAPYLSHISRQAKENTAFRRVLFTGKRMQVVVMSIPPRGDIGWETHDKVEQILVCVSGEGKAVLDGKSSPFVPGTLVVVTPGTKHNFINTGQEPLKLYTIYAPPNHIDQRVQHTKADAAADRADEEFGRQVE